jgi:diguanylate cyclase (GGDEF)-like protein
VLFYPTVNRSAALELAEELRMKILELKIPHEKSLTADYVSISIGVVSCIPGWELEFDALLQSADDALYLSKTNGRNRVTCGEFEIDKEP